MGGPGIGGPGFMGGYNGYGDKGLGKGHGPSHHRDRVEYDYTCKSKHEEDCL